MSNPNLPKLVTTAYLQAPVSGLGIIPGGTTTLSKEKTPGVILNHTDQGLLLSKGNLLALIPLTNVKIMVYASEQ